MISSTKSRSLCRDENSQDENYLIWSRSEWSYEDQFAICHFDRSILRDRAVPNKNPALAYTAMLTGTLSAESNERARSASDCYCGEAGLPHGTALFILVRYLYLPPCLRSTKYYVLNIYERLICTTERILHALLADHRRISSFLLRCYSTGIVFCSCCPNETSRFVPYFRVRVPQLPTWNEMPACGASHLASSLVVTVWDVRDHELARVTSLSLRLYCSPAASCLLAFLAAFLLAVISPAFFLR